MGKFPGKPSKIVNRRRINVLRCTTVKEDESVKAAETIYHALSIFNKTFGNDEQDEKEFKGFSRQEVQLAVTHARLHLRDTEAECQLNGIDISLEKSFNEEFSRFKHQCTPPRKTSSKQKKKQCFDGGGDNEKQASRDLRFSKENSSKVRRNQSFDGGGNVGNLDVNNCVNIDSDKNSAYLRSGKKFSAGQNTGGGASLKNNAAKKLLQKAMKACNIPTLNPDSMLQDKGINGALRKFVLPTRSAHSSRVIKPNKRFIDVAENGDEMNVAQLSTTTGPLHLKKPKLLDNPLNTTSESHCTENTRVFGENLQKDDVIDNCGTFNFEDFSGKKCNVSDVQTSPKRGKLIVEGKRRWKPSYKVQLKLRELNVFGAGTSKFPFRRNLGSSTDASGSVNSGSDKEVVPRATNDCFVGKSVKGGLAGSSFDNKTNSVLRVPGSRLITGSKIILKEARLKLKTQTSSLSDGPFSSSVHPGASLPETVICGVCGAARFYRFVKQARKFGILSCESCRKFISKMIRSTKVGNFTTLQCLKGEGTCFVPPVVRSQQWKSGGTMVRCSYKARCPACWLKMCLRSFKMPDAERANLISMLPPQMQNGCTDSQMPVKLTPISSSPDLTSSFLSKPFNLGFPDLPPVNKTLFPKEWPIPVPVLFQRDPFAHLRNSAPKVKDKNSNLDKPNKKKTQKDTGANLVKTVECNSLTSSTKSRKKSSKTFPAKKDTFPESSKKKKKGSKTKISAKDVAHHTSGNVWSTPRQRLELKGPRVKHVCRSASIVLGQAPATFPVDQCHTEPKTKQKPDSSKGKSKLPCVDSKDDYVGSKHTHTEKTSSIRTNSSSGDLGKSANTQSCDAKQDITKKQPHAEETSATVSDESTSLPSQSFRKIGSNKLPSARNLPVPGKRSNPETLNQVSIDFWESYDPEEVCNTGFGLIGSEPFHVRAICFLCGSGGLEQLIHCASCCEPYHRFCLEDGLREGGDEWRYNWICQRCTVCHTCGRGQGQQLSCQRCHKTYHTECLGSSRLHSPDRPWVCPSCLRCKSCGATDVTVFVGNLPLCKACFKLRQKGNYCPLCQRCYEDHDYDTKMMECAKCSCWVHAKCEGLSDEKYQVLSYLPDSVEFVCKMCYSVPPAPWWIAVEEELRAGYLSVLKSLSKNRKACALLKSSPKKQCSCRTLLGGKQLVFNEPLHHSLKLECTEKDSALCIGSSNKHSVEIPASMVTEESTCSSSDPNISNRTDTEITTKIEKIDEGLPKVDDKVADFMNHNLELTNSDKLLMKKCNSATNLSMNETSLIDRPLEQRQSCPSLLTVPECFSHETSPRSTLFPDPALKLYWEKYNIKECSVRVQDILPKPSAKTLLPVKVEVPDLLQEGAFCESGKSPHKILPASLSTPCSDSGISSTDEELKPCISIESSKEVVPVVTTVSVVPCSNTEVAEAGYSSSNGEENPVSESEGAISESSNDVCVEKSCHCMEVTQSEPSLTLLSVKKKVNASEYSSLLQFHQEMENLISRSDSGELLETYHHSLQEVFPWFDPKYARVSSRPMHEDHFYCQSPSKFLPVDSCENSFSDDNKFLNDSEKEKFGNKIAKLLADKDSNYYYSSTSTPDMRTCVLCKGVGDGSATAEGRLLYCGQNEWAHTNCALWSAEVFEEIDGSLQNVHSAVSRGRMIRCPWCEKRGASVGCCARNCNETYHFPCARKAKCTFMDDKNVYCPTHAKDATGKILKLDSEFDVRRPIYVELDRKKKKFSNVQKVRFMIGSLLVENLGEFIAGASDLDDIILPNGFCCTRYFWSSVEPWRVVQYHVKTIVKQQLPEPAEDLGWNITIDHSEDQEIVDHKLEELAVWQKEAVNLQGKRIPISFKNTPRDNVPNKPREKVLVQNLVKAVPRGNSEEDKVAHQVISYLLDTICSKEVEESCLVDPQSTADILPPELKDAIFEDLPHDILDGISMQDIFPKLMSYEDVVGLDIKSDGSCGSDVTRDGKDDLGEDAILSAEVDAINLLSRGKKLEQSSMEFVSQQDNWFTGGDQKDQVSNLVEDLFPPVFNKNTVQKYSNRELKRSKSEGISQPVPRKITGSSRSQQRSCSLTWSCKLDGTAGSSNTKRRKGSRTSTRSSETASNFTDCVGYDRAYMLQELRVSEGGIGSIPRTSTSSTSTTGVEGMRDLKMRLDEESSSTAERRKMSHPKEEGKENKWLLWHSKNQSRILQLDGTVDSSSGSEGGKSPKRIDEDDDEDEDGRNDHLRLYPPAVSRRNFMTNVLNKEGDDEPVRCSRCHRTYRTRTSFERHLPTCSSDFILSTSESDSETTRSSEEESPKQSIVDDPLECSQNDNLPNVQNGNNIPLPTLPKLSTSSEELQERTQTTATSLKTLNSNSTTLLLSLENQETKLNSSIHVVAKPGIQLSSSTSPVKTNAKVLSSNTPGLDSSNVLQKIPPTTLSVPTSKVKVASSVNVNSSRMPNTSSSSSSSVRNRGNASRNRSRGSLRTSTQRNTARNIGCQSVPPVNSQTPSTPGTQYVQMMHTPCGPATSQPTVFVQQVASPSVVPAFVEAFQQHTGQSLQYIATIDAHSKHPFIASTPSAAIVPGTFQIQASPDGFSGMQNGSIPVLPSVQINPPQPTVLGTIIPQPQPATIQCGMVAAEQMVLGSTPGMEVYTDQSGGMFVASQPMFIGLETIVSNTVMQSQQIVSSALPGVMAASSSFSATTTQVFQASKIEPIVDVPSGFVIVNPQGTLAEAGMGNPEVVACPPTHVPISLASHLSPHTSPVVTQQPQITTPVSSINTVPIPNSVPTGSPLPNGLPPPLMQTSLPVSSAIPTSTTIPIVSPLLNTPPISAPIHNPPSVTSPTVVSMPASTLPPVSVPSSSTYVITSMCSAPQNSVLVSVSSPIITHTSVPSIALTSSAPSSMRPSQTHIPVSVAQPLEPSSQQNLPWRYTQDVPSNNSTYVPLRRHYPPVAPQVSASNAQLTTVQSTISLPVSKTVVTASCVPAPVTISSHQSNSSVRVVKTVSTVCSTVSSPLTVPSTPNFQSSKPPSMSQKPIVPVNGSVSQQQNIAIQKISMQTEQQSKVVPVVNGKSVSQNSKTNTLKLVLQKQPQDGLYKITPNQNIRILSSAKQVTNISMNKNGKPKSRSAPSVDKCNEQENYFVPSVLQPSQTNINLPTSTLNGTKHIPNGKLSFLKDSSPAKEISPSIVFELRSQDGFSYTSSDITEVWQKVFEAVQQARVAHKMPPLPQNPFLASQDGLQMLGLKHNGLRYLVEQLPGAGRCIKYKPRYHKQHPPSPEEDVDALPLVNKTGSARSQPFTKRSPYDMFSWLASRHRQPPKFIVNADGESISNRRATSSNLPMAMRFRHLKETSKEAVGVYRSHIHGRGLFCLRDIDAGEMVIEYAGEVIRSTLTDKREKLYESKGIGCYMFRIDDHLVVDATMRGNAARFINHSCEPNCYSRVVDILGKKHILIFALRRIPQGEELTYDYKFPFEDVKIPCTCGSRRCRKYLN